MMFTITLAFMIFGTCNFDNVGFLISAGIKEAIGADISILKLIDLKRHEEGDFSDPTKQKIINLDFQNKIFELSWMNSKKKGM